MDQGWPVTARQFKDYLLSCGRAPRTAETYVANLSQFWRDCRRWEITPYEADRHLLRGWVADRLAIASGQRVHNQMAALRLFYAWLNEVGYRDDDPTQGIKVKRGRSLPTDPLSDNDIAALLSAAKTERDRLIILVLAATGMRISELASLTAEDINWRDGTLKVKGKGDKERVLKPQAAVLQRLRAFMGMFAAGPIWLSQQRQEPLSAQQLRKIIYHLGERAQVASVHPHRLRASFATAYIDQYADIQALQGVMGHESIETTARYSESSRQRRGLKQMEELDMVTKLTRGKTA